MASRCPLTSTSSLKESLLKGRSRAYDKGQQARRLRQPQPGATGSATGSPATSTASSGEGLTVFDGVAIIAGTSIGGGFLALPSLTTPMGFLPATTGLFVSWAFLALTALAYAEATLRSIVKQNAARATDPGLAEAAVDEPPECSVLTVTRCSLGGGCSMLCSAAFATLMFVVMTAQVVKAGEILSVLSGMPYVMGCVIPSVAIGLFSFCACTRIVEQVNTLLTVALVGGFVALIFTTVVGSAGGTTLAAVAQRLAFADWTWLLPSGPAWALPVFINLISFGQTVPVVVARFGVERARDIQTSILLGSFIPFVLCATWAAVSAALLDPSGGKASCSDPVLRMLAGRLAVAVPVGLVAVGAIGTSLVANYLSLGQFVTDGIFALRGRCTLRAKRIARVAVVVLPLFLACGGPELYIPLLAFAGAYPTNFLFGLIPCLAAITLRWAQHGRKNRPWQGSRDLQLVPGGLPMLLLLSFLAVTLIALSGAISLRSSS